MQIVN